MKPKRSFHKFTAWLMIATMLMTFIPTFSLTASADGSGTAVPIVTDVDFNRSSPAYNDSENIFYISDANPFELIVTGENLTLFNETGGLQALFKGSSSSSGWVITNMTILSDTEASISIGTSSFSYILNNSFGSDKITAVMVENKNTQYGNTVYVDLKHAPTYQLSINSTVGGTVYHNNFFSNFIAVGTTVTLTAEPDSGYELESLVVDGTDVTDAVSGNTYSFTMPENPVLVYATFKTAPVTYTVTVSADKDEAVVGETVTLTAEVKANGTAVNNADVSWETTAGSGLHAVDSLTATITPESEGTWTVTALYDPTPADDTNGDEISGNTTVTIKKPVASVTTDHGTTKYSDITSAFAAAQANSGSKLTLLDNIFDDTQISVDSGMFTLDLNGKHWKSSGWVLLNLKNDANVKIEDSVGSGIIEANTAIVLNQSSKLEVSGGTIDGNSGNAVDMSFAGNATSSELVLSGGKFMTDNSAAIQAFGNKLTISDGEIVALNFSFAWKQGTVDLSQNPDPSGISFFVGDSYTDVSIDKISLPDGYIIVDYNTGNKVTAVVPGSLYKIAEDDGGTNTPIPYNLYVGGEQFTSEKLTISDGNGGTAIYDPASSTLTLDSYSYTGIYGGVVYWANDGDVLNLVLNGDNSFNITAQGSADYSVGILCSEADLIISGDGSLKAEIGHNALSYVGDAIHADGDIIIKGGEITVLGGKTDNSQACGIVSTSGNITIEGGKITATGGEGKMVAGICAYGNILIKGGEITATSGASVNGYYGAGIISSSANITIEGGTVSATGNNTPDGYNIGILAYENITIKGGTVSATGGQNNYISYGLYSESLNVDGGVVTTQGHTKAICSDSISINDDLAVFAKDGTVIDNPDFNTLTYAKIDEAAAGKYMLTWSNGNGGSYDQQIAYGTTITVPTNQFFNDTMAKKGYTIVGWTNGDGYNVGDAMPAKALTFTAQYRANTYTVSFDANGGTAAAPITVTYGENYGTLPSSSITGFSGGNKNWYLVDENGDVTDTNIKKLSKVETARDHVLFMKRSVLSPALKITLEVPGAISDDYKYYVPGNSTRILTAAIDNKNDSLLNYTYQWYKNGIAVVGATEPTLTLAGNVSDAGTYKVIVTASLKANTGIIVAESEASAEKEKKVDILHATNTLNYDANGGTGGPTSNYTGGTAITVSSNVPEKDAFHFAGWNTKPDGSGDSYNPRSTYTFENDNGNGGCTVTLYAQWKQKVTIFFDQSIQTYVYDGTEKAFELRGTNLTDISVKYKQNNLDTVPKNAGAYDVVITRAQDNTYNEIDVTITGGLVIEKKAINSKIDLAAPIKNAAPQTKIIGEGYEASVVWSPIVTTKFGYNTEYTATITITTDENHTVSGILANGYTVEGAKAVTNDKDSNVLTVTYNKTGGNPSAQSAEIPSYTIKFAENGGTYVADETVKRNFTLSKPKDPTKDGFTFGGWYTNTEFTKEYNFSSKVTKSFTLFAKWNEDNAHGNPLDDCPSLDFDDLDITHWYHLDTDYVIANGIFKGTAERIFEPHSPQTRAMMVTVLYRAEGEPEVSGEATFEDVDENAYYAKAVLWGQQNGIIKGYSEKEFGPNDNITREQIAAIMHRYAQYLGLDVSVGENTNILSYDDFDKISEYAIPSMQWAVGSGLIKGRTESTLNPLESTTRAEIAAILHRFLKKIK